MRIKVYFQISSKSAYNQGWLPWNFKLIFCIFGNILLFLRENKDESANLYQLEKGYVQKEAKLQKTYESLLIHCYLTKLKKEDFFSKFFAAFFKSGWISVHHTIIQSQLTFEFNCVNLIKPMKLDFQKCPSIPQDQKYPNLNPLWIILTK